MEGIIALIVIIAAFVRMNENMKKVKQNPPGRSGAPMMPAESAKPVVQPARPIVMQPTVQTTVKPAEPSKSFWEQMMESIEELEGEMGTKQKDVESAWGSLSKQKAAEPKAPLGTKTASSDSGHAAVSSLNEGVSRECEHGSIGGSMAYTHSDGMPVMQRRAAQQDEQPDTPVYSLTMDAEEMRRAVVMAEILKRPQERMAEQARRWTLR